MYLTDDQLAAFNNDGYIVISGLFDDAQISAALDETELRTYGQSYGDHLAGLAVGASSNEDIHTRAASAVANDPRRIQFPTGSRALDSLLHNDGYLDCFADCLGTQDMAYCNAHLFVRSGPDDTRYDAEPWMGYHIDDTTCSFLPPHPDFARYAYINSWVLLHDIEEDGAPLHVIPGSHRQIADIYPRLVESGGVTRAGFRDLREIPELGSKIALTARAGDALFYSSYLVHGAVAFADKKKQRALWSMSLARAENSWTGFSELYQYAVRNYALEFWTHATPRVRSLFGWPRPGHPYYTPHTLQLLAAWFPGIDLAPYRQA